MKMKKILLALSLLLILVFEVLGQENTSFTIKTYKLDNGLTVILNPDKNSVGTFGMVGVKAGSKNDPADATGMAHYLEHLLFKGTNELGTTDYAKEKPFLDSIVYYYDLLGKTKDEKERKRILSLVNNQSVQSANYANPTEFDKLIKSIGGTDLNAFTSNDMTVYLNAFPGDQLEKWLELYAHRFQNPVFRSFQSELEVVYEEKNRGMDSPFNQLQEDLMANLFKTHPYGTQSTIGTVEHLKNPSLTKMYKYFNDYYVANNMALVISGNFNLENAMKWINEKFGKLRSAPIPVFPEYAQSKFDKKEIIEVKYTPLKVGYIGYKTVKNGHKDQLALEICTSLLSNQSETGSLNKLQLDGKLLFGAGYNMNFNDDGATVVVFGPKIIGQSFKEAETLIYEAVENIKKGVFSDTILNIIKQEIEIQRKKELEDEQNRAYKLMYLFLENSDWNNYLKQLEDIKNITKEDIIRVANQYFIDNHLIIESSMGFPAKTTLDKPGFKPVVASQKIESEYCKNYLATLKESETPKILDYYKDAVSSNLHGSTPFYITANPYNDVFTLKIQRAVGTDSIKNLDLAANLFNYFHTKNLTRDQLKQAFAIHGISYYASVDENRFTIIFEGLETNLKNALPIIKSLIEEPVVEENSIKTVVEGVISSRKSELKSPETMGSMLLWYSVLGNKSKSLIRPSEKQLKALTAQEILETYKKINQYKATWHYIGNSKEIKSLLENSFSKDTASKFIPFSDKEFLANPTNKVLMMNDKKAVQGQIYFLIKTPNFSGNTKDKVYAEAFNNYMNDGFSGILMQEIREYRSLAYTTSGAFIVPTTKNKPGAFYSYVGCQMDKTNESIVVMDSILRFLPQKPDRINMIKSGLINSISSNYPSFRYISTSIAKGREKGYVNSPLQEEYPLYKSLTFDNIVDFYNSNLINRPRIITIYGNLKLLDKKKLAQFGEIEVLKPKQIRID